MEILLLLNLLLLSNKNYNLLVKRMKKALIYSLVILMLSLSFSTIISSEKQNNIEIFNSELRDIESYNIEIDIKFGSYEIKKMIDGDDIVLEDFGQITTPGNPKLPYKIISIALPPNTYPIKISNKYKDPIILPGIYNIRAAPSPIQGNTVIDNFNSDDIFSNNFKNIYYSNEPFPNKNVNFVRTSGYRNYNLIDLEVYPFSYQPMSGVLSFYPEIKISINYAYINDKIIDINSENSRVERIAEDIIFNYNQTKEWYIQSNSNTNGLYDFVIITLDSLTEAVEPLIQWETDKGRNVKVVTKSWIETNYNGFDTAGKIRNFLRDKYPNSEWGIEDVLIVGHYDDIPLREMWQTLTGDERPETDFYYAELSKPDNESWDSNNNQKYGDNLDLIDFYAEVNVGRVPWSDFEIVNNICEKSVNYEMNTDPSYKNNILLLAAFVDDQTDGAVYTEYIANTTINPWMDYWTKTRLYDRDSIYPKNDILNHMNVVSTWTQNKFSFVAWHAHGSPYGSGNFISVDDCELLNDDYPAIISAASCSNSDTDYLNIGQAMMKQGAVGFLGANKAAYYCSGWENPNDGSDQSFKYFFTSCVTSGEYTQGQALQYAIKEMYTRGLWTQLKYETFIHSSLWGNPDLGIGINSDNNPPIKPDRPNGPNDGKVRQLYTFTSKSIDPDNDQIYYLWSWGDGNSEWMGPYNSGEEVSITHEWNEEGSFEVRVKCKDIKGSVSEWSDSLTISMPKNISYNKIIKLFKYLIEAFPLLEDII